MTAIEAPARVTVTKGRLFTRRRYLAELWIGDIHTGLTWNLTRREAKSYPQLILDNASQLLERHGLMDEMYERYTKLQHMRALAAIPVKGSKVRLTEKVSEGLARGTVGTVTHIDERPDAPYPLTVAFVIDGKTEEVPVELAEVEAV